MNKGSWKKKWESEMILPELSPNKKYGFGYSKLFHHI